MLRLCALKPNLQRLKYRPPNVLLSVITIIYSRAFEINVLASDNFSKIVKESVTEKYIIFFL